MKRWAVVLFAWWAMFTWPPVDEPPGYVMVGPFRSQQECLTWASSVRDRASGVYGWHFQRCVQLPEVF